MATFSWNTDTGGTWNTGADWTLVAGTGTPPPGSTIPNTDVAIITKIDTTAYTVTLGAGTTFDVNELDIGTTGAAGDPTLHIAGTLLTSTLSYNSGSNTPSTIEIDAGGVFDIRTTIGEVSAVGETIKISGSGAGGVLALGSLTDVVNPNVHFTFDDVGTKVHNTGVIEYQSGFTSGSTLNQYIAGWDWGDSVIVGGANFTGDTVTYNRLTTTLTVKDASLTTCSR
jgi:hypothetical protein